MSDQGKAEEVVALLDAAVPVVPPAAVPEDEEGAGAAEEEGEPKREPRTMGFSVESMNEKYALLALGKGVLVMHEDPDAPLDDRLRFMTVDAFRLWFKNRRTEYKDAADNIKSATWADKWLASRKRREYRGIQFRPGEGPVTTGYFNLWRGFSVEPKEGGSFAIYRDHLLNNVCQGDQHLFEWVFAWFAHIFQRPRERIGTSLVLRGAMGSGKTKVGEVMGSLIAAHYFMVDDPRYVTGQFNAHMSSCLLLQAEEAVWAGDKAAEGRLKGLVTSKTQMIEQKGVDSIRLENYVRLIMTSNEDWVVPAGKDERRFCVLDVGNAVSQNHEYFGEMEAELEAGGREALLHALLSVDLSKFNLREIPKTAALLEQKIHHLDPVEQWWFGRLRDGAPTKHHNTWTEVVARSAIFADFFDASEKAGVKRRGFETEIGLKLRKIIPGLGATRTDIHGKGDRVRCYVLPSLADARDGFMAAVKQRVYWPVEEETEQASQPETIDDG